MTRPVAPFSEISSNVSLEKLQRSQELERSDLGQEVAQNQPTSLFDTPKAAPKKKEKEQAILVASSSTAPLEILVRTDEVGKSELTSGGFVAQPRKSPEAPQVANQVHEVVQRTPEVEKIDFAPSTSRSEHLYAAEHHNQKPSDSYTTEVTIRAAEVEKTDLLARPPKQSEDICYEVTRRTEELDKTVYEPGQYRYDYPPEETDFDSEEEDEQRLREVAVIRELQQRQQSRETVSSSYDELPHSKDLPKSKIDNHPRFIDHKESEPMVEQAQELQELHRVHRPPQGNTVELAKDTTDITVLQTKQKPLPQQVNRP